MLSPPTMVVASRLLVKLEDIVFPRCSRCKSSVRYSFLQNDGLDHRPESGYELGHLGIARTQYHCSRLDQMIDTHYNQKIRFDESIYVIIRSEVMLPKVS